MAPYQPHEGLSVSRFALHPFELWVAVAALVSAVAYFVSPATLGGAALAKVSPTVAAVWNVLYGLGGIGVIAGYFRSSPRLEGFGLCLLTAGVLVSSIAILYLRGVSGIPSFTITIGAAVACAVRLRFLVRVAQK